MCEPISLTTGLIIASTTIAAAGAVYAGVSQAKQYKYQASIAATNAALDRKAAQDALARGSIEEARQYRRTAQLMGQQRAALAANGVEVDFGSAFAVQTDTKQLGWEDARTIRENAVREARGFEVQAFNQDAKAASAKASAKSAITGALFDAGGTILSGASKFAGAGGFGAPASAGGGYSGPDVGFGDPSRND